MFRRTIFSLLGKAVKGFATRTKSISKKYKDFRQVLITPYTYHIIYEIDNTVVVIYKVIYAGIYIRMRYKK